MNEWTPADKIHKQPLWPVFVPLDYKINFICTSALMTIFSILQDKYIVGRKPHLPHQDLRQKLSGNPTPLNTFGFLAIELNI